MPTAAAARLRRSSSYASSRGAPKDRALGDAWASATIQQKPPSTASWAAPSRRRFYTPMQTSTRAADAPRPSQGRRGPMPHARRRSTSCTTRTRSRSRIDAPSGRCGLHSIHLHTVAIPVAPLAVKVPAGWAARARAAHQRSCSRASTSSAGSQDCCRADAVDATFLPSLARAELQRQRTAVPGAGRRPGFHGKPVPRSVRDRVALALSAPTPTSTLLPKTLLRRSIGHLHSQRREFTHVFQLLHSREGRRRRRTSCALYRAANRSRALRRHDVHGRTLGSRLAHVVPDG